MECKHPISICPSSNHQGVTGVPPVGFGVLRNLGNKKATFLP